MRENLENQPKPIELTDAFWLVSEALYEVSKTLGLPAEMLAESLGLEGIRCKYSEIKQIKEEQKLDPAARSLLMGVRDDRETRDRRDRDHQHFTLTALLAGASYRAAWDKAMDGLPELGRDMDKFQDEIDALLAGEKALLKADLERVAARLPNGRYVFKGADGSIVGEDLKPLEGEDAEAVKNVEFTGKMTLEQYRDRKGKIDRLEAISDDNRRDRVRIGEIQEDLTNEDPPLKQETVESHGKEKDEIKDRLEGRQREVVSELKVASAANVADAPVGEGVSAGPSAVASMAKPPM